MREPRGVRYGTLADPNDWDQEQFEKDVLTVQRAMLANLKRMAGFGRMADMMIDAMERQTSFGSAVHDAFQRAARDWDDIPLPFNE